MFSVTGSSLSGESNATQLASTTERHCSAHDKVNGSDTDVINSDDKHSQVSSLKAPQIKVSLI